MEYRYVDISDSVSIPVPAHLSPQETTNYIAARIAFVNFKELEAEMREMLQHWKEGKLIPVEEVLKELEHDAPSANGQSA